MNIHTKYKELYVIGFLVVVLVVVSIGTSLRDGTPSIALNNRSDESSSAETDTDKDGLLDWEEYLWSTDPRNPDTDGDGTPDGAETVANRDPAVAGPNDSLEQTLTQKKSALSTPDGGTVNTTEALSRELVASAIALKGAEGDLTKEELDNLAISVAQSTIPAAEPTYIITDLSISADTSAGALKNYGNALGALINRHALDTHEDELLIVARALNTGNESELAALTPIAAKYRRFAEEVLAITVPQTAVVEHLALANHHAQTARAVEDMAQVIDDPVVGLAGVGLYRQQIPQTFEVLTRLRSVFDRVNISFSISEPGFIFN